jgi:hypothetical protein
MRRRLFAVLFGAFSVAGLCRFASARDRSDFLSIDCENASSWVEGDRRIVLAEDGVTLQTDSASLSAERAVVWLTQLPGEEGYLVEVSLIGNAKVRRGAIERDGTRLSVTTTVRPDVRLNVAKLLSRDKSDDVNFLAGLQLKQSQVNALPPPPDERTEKPVTPDQGPIVLPDAPVSFQARTAKLANTDDGRVALALSGDVLVMRTAANGDRVELQADHAVLFTNLADVRGMVERNELQNLDPRRDFESVYLEGDVRASFMPSTSERPEQRLSAERVLYEFATDRAILSQALLRTTEPTTQLPLTVRASTMKKVGEDAYVAEKASISTSTFASPSISLAADKVTINQSNRGDLRRGTRTAFDADDVTVRSFGVPFLWLPSIWGSVTESGSPLRGVQVGGGQGTGFGVQTQWGLFESIGMAPPRGLDATYNLDYFTERGPAVGLSAKYAGSVLDPNTGWPKTFEGDFTSYLVYDKGQDRLGADRRRINWDDEFRGRISWKHQHFLSDVWQLQAQASYVSDGTFLEEWFEREFNNGLPQETSLYLKRQSGSESIGFLVAGDLSDVASVAEQLQEVAVTGVDVNGNANEYSPVLIDRLPEISYHRVGESLLADTVTWHSNNSLSGLRFNEADDSLADLGFRNRANTDEDEGFAGVPSYAYTGVDDDFNYRADFRQEIAFPFGDDRLRVAPYLMGRYTWYDKAVDGDHQGRLLGGVGLRASTTFSRVFDGWKSRRFDLNRVRHIIEPQLNLFASVQDTDRDELYIYDEQVDGVSDLLAAQLLVRQRFQTKRGGPGRWRTVDFLTVNTGINVFANEPDEVGPLVDTSDLRSAEAFRGVFYSSLPEASIARDGIFADATWRISDTTAVLTDASYNLASGQLNTAAIGVAVQRDPRVRYFLGTRYIGEINSTLASLSVSYQLSTKYAVSYSHSIELSNDEGKSFGSSTSSSSCSASTTIRSKTPAVCGFHSSPRALPASASPATCSTSADLSGEFLRAGVSSRHARVDRHFCFGELVRHVRRRPVDQAGPANSGRPCRVAAAGDTWPTRRHTGFRDRLERGRRAVRRRRLARRRQGRRIDRRGRLCPAADRLFQSRSRPARHRAKAALVNVAEVAGAEPVFGVRDRRRQACRGDEDVVPASRPARRGDTRAIREPDGRDLCRARRAA